MKKLFPKIAAVVGLFAVSAAAYAANMDCCADLVCCLRMLGDCC